MRGGEESEICVEWSDWGETEEYLLGGTGAGGRRDRSVRRFSKQCLLK